MAMLAEPRRKQKLINLRAKNNAWSNDSTKFGQRMLEKMGWSSGKGLGANENGIVEHVVAKYKNDDKGLGFEDRNDQWTKHEDDFNSLLANLSNGDGDIKDEKLHSGVSLEVKSKKSKARVHYHKYTRGKDLTRYSDKDLANIFGKKTLKSNEKVPDILKPDELKTTEVVFTEKGSMEDYFKNKMAALKGKNKINLDTNFDNDNADFVFRGFAGTYTENPEENSDNVENDVAFQGFSCFGSNGIENQESIDEPIKKKSKKSKKSKKLVSEAQENINLEMEPVLETNDDCEEVEPMKKKTKKNKHKVVIEDEVATSEEPPKKKNKKSAEAPQITEENVDENIHVPKKKKKRKNKNNEM